MKELIELNKKMWDDRVSSHMESDFYAVDKFKNGETSLNKIELDILGKDLTDKKVLHLQCHFGMDSLSLARMGAKVTGIDFSEEAVAAATRLNDELGLDAKFICSDVLKTEEVLDEKFDLIFTSYGTITWLPELGQWGKIINDLLKPGGRFLIVEFHPVLWMFDDDVNIVEYGYFNSGPIIEETSGSYASDDTKLKHKFAGWNHSFDEVIEALLGRDLLLTHFKEYDYSPYPIFKEGVKFGKGYHVKGLEGKLPLVYSIAMEKKQ